MMPPSDTLFILAAFLTALFQSSTLVTTQKLIEITYKIHEELPNGSFVGNIVNDANLSSLYDSAEFRDMRLAFLDPIHPSNSFFLDPVTGVLETGSAKIDRETLCPNKEACSVQLDIETTPQGLDNLIKVTVTILDINDNEPVFSSDRLVLEVSERMNVGWTYPLYPAADPDSPKFSIANYAMTYWSSSQGPFELRWEKPLRRGMIESLYLELVEALDREKQEIYLANITATDGGSPPKSKTIILEVRVTDVNDNEPIFDQPSYAISVKEDLPVGTSIIKVHATDADEDLNGQVVYRLPESSKFGKTFKIDNMTGEIFLEDRLDYEIQSSYMLTVIAHDLGMHSVDVRATVFIDVQDVNDNKPQIFLSDTSSNSVSVVENNPPGTFVAWFRVEDPDSGDGGKFDCYIEDGRVDRDRSSDEHAFKLTKVSTNRYKIQTNYELDREIKESYTLKIFCDDRGAPSLRSELFLDVTVEDVNDCTPKFHRTRYSVDVPENNYEGSVVIAINAYDCDAGVNAKISYKLLSGKDYFAIDQAAGAVTTLVSIDREQIGDVLNFTAAAVDGGHPPRSAVTSVTVNIIDVNDNRPIFDALSYHFNASENLSNTALAGRVRASDSDRVHSDNARIVYSILPGISSMYFQISEDTGIISTSKTLDRESISVHHLVVSARDCGSPPLSSTIDVTLDVTDRNDNPPLFEFPPSDNTTIQLSTRASAGYEVARFRATDLDAGANGEVTYGMDNGTLAEKGLEGMFSLDPGSGTLTLCSNDIRRFNGLTVVLKIWSEDKAVFPDVRLRTESLIRITFNISAPIMINGELIDGDNWMLVLGFYGDGLTTVALIGAATIAGLLTVIAVLIIYCLKKKRHVIYRKEKHFSDERHQQYNCRTGSLKIFNPTLPTSNVHVDFTSDNEYGRCDDIEVPLNNGAKSFEVNESRSLLNNYNSKTVDQIRPIQSECKSNIYTTQPVANFGNYWPTVSQYGRMTSNSPQCPLVPESPLPPYQQLDVGRGTPVTSSCDHRSINQSAKPSKQLTRADKEARHLLEILKEDSVLESISLSSDQGVNSDSGKGASEEGGEGRFTHHVDECLTQQNNIHRGGLL